MYNAKSRTHRGASRIEFTSTTTTQPFVLLHRHHKGISRPTAGSTLVSEDQTQTLVDSTRDLAGKHESPGFGVHCGVHSVRPSGRIINQLEMPECESEFDGTIITPQVSSSAWSIMCISEPSNGKRKTGPSIATEACRPGRTLA